MKPKLFKTRTRRELEEHQVFDRKDQTKMTSNYEIVQNSEQLNAKVLKRLTRSFREQP